MLWSVFILSFLLINRSNSEEQHCSRFHYDDQLLEKMIRMEGKDEAMEKVILSANKQMLERQEEVQETMKALKSERADLKGDYTDFKTKIMDDFNIIKAKVEAMEKVIMNANKQMLERQEEVQETLNTLRSERADLKGDYADFKTKIMCEFNIIKDTLSTPTIVFKARQPADVSLETGQTVVFSKTMMNDGEAYDSITGIFTAPVGGTYLFTVHLCVIGAQTFYYGIMCDNTVKTSGRFYENTSTACHTADAVLVLESRQKVWVKCLSGGTSNVLYESSSSTHNFWNTFSGALVHK